MRKVGSVLVVAVLLACLCAGPAIAAETGWLGIVDVGPAAVLGSGGGVYPADLTLNLLPIKYDQQIPTDEGLTAMVKGALQYGLANTGVDLLFANVSSFEDVVYGASLPVVNEVAGFPVRFGGVYLQDVGPRGLLRLDVLDLIAGKSDDSGDEVVTTLAPLFAASDRSRLGQWQSGLPAMPIIAQTDRPSMVLSWAGDAVQVMYWTSFQ